MNSSPCGHARNHTTLVRGRSVSAGEAEKILENRNVRASEQTIRLVLSVRSEGDFDEQSKRDSRGRRQVEPDDTGLPWCWRQRGNAGIAPGPRDSLHAAASIASAPSAHARKAALSKSSIVVPVEWVGDRSCFEYPGNVLMRHAQSNEISCRALQQFAVQFSAGSARSFGQRKQRRGLPLKPAHLFARRPINSPASIHHPIRPCLSSSIGFLADNQYPRGVRYRPQASLRKGCRRFGADNRSLAVLSTRLAYFVSAA